MFSWHKQIFSRLLLAKSENHLPHALLFSGISGLGKAVFADSLSKALLCESPVLGGESCNACHACRLVEGRAHPNVLWLQPEKPGHAIKVDQVREIQDFINQTSMQDGYRIVIIHPADYMNINAANALLKTLEEPAPGSLLILVSDQFGQLPATVLSRCHRIIFTAPSHEEALNWLKTHEEIDMSQADLALNLTHGAPLAALRFLSTEVKNERREVLRQLYALMNNEQQPVAAAQALKEVDPLNLIDYLLGWMVDLLGLQLNAREPTNADYQSELSSLKEKTTIHKNIHYLNQLQTMRGQICRGINFNKQLLGELLMIKWMECA